MTSSILVLGAAGFIGSHLVDALLAQGETVIGLDNLSTGRMENLVNAQGHGSRFTFALHDVREPLPTWAPIVFNLACPASPKAYQADPVGTIETSVVGTLRLIEAARKRPFTLVHASTSEVYGNPSVSPQPEDYWGHVNPIGVRACYDESKRCAEAALISSGVSVRIARIFNTYGPRMAWNDGRAVPAFVHAAINNWTILLHGNGQQTRSFCFVSDTVRGLLKLLNTNYRIPFNIGNDAEITIRELAEQVLRLTGNSDGPILISERPADDPDRRRPDLSRAREVLNYEPTVTLEQGLCLVIAEARTRQKLSQPGYLLDTAGVG